MKRNLYNIILLNLISFTPIKVFAGIDESINNFLEPVSKVVSSIVFYSLITKFVIKLFFLNKFNTLVIVFDLLLMPSLNFPEKFILSLELFIFFIDITSCNSQKVTNEIIL